MNTEYLPITFEGIGEAKGSLFTKIYTDEQHYIYQRKVGKISYFEVFERKSSPICLDFANRVYSDTHFKEIYPKSEEFGKSAWCCRNIGKARDFMTQSEERIKQR